MKENVIINKINYITNKILKENESEIFDHLQEVDVTLHPFGMYGLFAFKYVMPKFFFSMFSLIYLFVIWLVDGSGCFSYASSNFLHV